MGSGQGDRWNGFQGLIIFYVSQHLAAIHLGQIQIEQDEVGTRCVGMDPFMPQKSHGFETVRSDVQTNKTVCLAKRFLRQAHIAWTVFDQEDLYRHFVPPDRIMTSS